MKVTDKSINLKIKIFEIDKKIDNIYTQIDNSSESLNDKELFLIANSEFDDLNNLKKTKDAKTLRLEKLQEIKLLKSKFKTEKLLIKKSNSDNIQKLEELNKIKIKYNIEINKELEEYKTLSRTISKTGLIIFFLIVFFSCLIIALSVNYAFYYPKLNNNSKPIESTSGILAIIMVFILILIAFFISFILLKDSTKRLPKERKKNTLSKGFVIGFITDFFDAIGIGSFAPTFVLLKAFKLNDEDKKIPGNLNVGHTIPVIFEAIIFIIAINVEPYTLIMLISSSVIGGYIGALIVNKVNKKIIKLIMSLVLFLTAILMILNHPFIGLFQIGGNEIGLSFKGWKLYTTSLIFLVLGFLMSFGIGLYAPAMMVVSLMGLDPTVAFPIMMGSTAFLMPAGSIKFIRDRNYDPKLTVGISMGGTLGVLASFLIIFVGIQLGLGIDKNNFVNYILILVILLSFYTSILMLYEYIKESIKDKGAKNVQQI